jgi:hypothetical protein
MKDALLYAFAALGVVGAARWGVRQGIQALAQRPAIRRRRQRALCRSAVTMITDPQFHQEAQRLVLDLAEDMAAAVASASQAQKADEIGDASARPLRASDTLK